MIDEKSRLAKADARRCKAESELSRAELKIQRLLVQGALAANDEYQKLVTAQFCINGEVHRLRVRIAKKNVRISNLLKKLPEEVQITVQCQQRERVLLEELARVRLEMESHIHTAHETSARREEARIEEPAGVAAVPCASIDGACAL